MDVQPTITAAIGEHLTVIQQLTAMSHLIQQVASELVATLRRQGKVVLCGNGGSASDAQHITAEMQGILQPFGAKSKRWSGATISSLASVRVAAH